MCELLLVDPAPSRRAWSHSHAGGTPAHNTRFHRAIGLRLDWYPRPSHLLAVTPRQTVVAKVRQSRTQRKTKEEAAGKQTCLESLYLVLELCGLAVLGSNGRALHVEVTCLALAVGPKLLRVASSNAATRGEVREGAMR